MNLLKLKSAVLVAAMMSVLAAPAYAAINISEVAPLGQQ